MWLSVVLCFWQLSFDPVRRTEQVQLEARAEKVSFERAQSEQLALQRREFEKRFNDLVEAVKNFSADYNRSAGAVWPSKKANDLRRAMQHLEDNRFLGTK